MAKSMSYDHPAYLVRGAAAFETAAGAAGVSAKFVAHADLRLKAAHVQVTTAGTSAGAGNGLTFKVGTTSIGSVALGSSTAGVSTSVDLGDALASKLDLISATNGTDASGKAAVTYEYEIVAGADVTE